MTINLIDTPEFHALIDRELAEAASVLSPWLPGVRTFLVWLPPRGQVVSLLRVHDRVRSCVRPLNAAFPLPRAGMVICGLGPNLRTELLRSEEGPGFPKPDLFDHCAHSGRRLLTLVSSPAVAAGRYRHAGATVAGSM